MNKKQWCSIIDHTLLRADATEIQIKQLTDEAKQYGFASVCIPPVWVRDAAEQLKGSSVKVCTVIGFPLGTSTSESKAFETRQAIQDGATEIDMVIWIGALKQQRDEDVERDIRGIVEAAQNKAIVKVIIETCLLTDQEKERACQVAVRAGAHFVKTSTGFSTGGATKEDIALMRRTVGPNVGVKASGGIRDIERMVQLIEAGASRIGTSSGVHMMQGTHTTSSY